MNPNPNPIEILKHFPKVDVSVKDYSVTHALRPVRKGSSAGLGLTVTLKPKDLG